MKLLIATGNQGKITEIAHEIQNSSLSSLGIKLMGLRDLPPGWTDVVEDRPTFIGNATKKARHFAAISGWMTLADDSGLCVDALNGDPGVFSARYAGEPCINAANNAKLLQALRDVPQTKRQAKFVCAMTLSVPGKNKHDESQATDLAVTEDEVKGEILFKPRGTNGFGYDPLFFHPQSNRTTAELTMEEKSQLSHRGKALRKMIAWMQNHWNQLHASSESTNAQ